MQDYKVHIKHTDGHYEYVPYFCLPAKELNDVIAPSCYSCFDYPNALADIVVGRFGRPVGGAVWFLPLSNRGRLKRRLATGPSASVTSLTTNRQTNRLMNHPTNQPTDQVGYMGVPYQGVDMTSHLQYITVRNEVRSLAGSLAGRYGEHELLMAICMRWPHPKQSQIG
jgi:hypothetical protein